MGTYYRSERGKEVTEEHQSQATPEELKALKRRCWSPPCKRRAFLRDWAGWQWCFKHWWRNLCWDGGNFWYGFRTTRVF